MTRKFVSRLTMRVLTNATIPARQSSSMLIVQGSAELMMPLCRESRNLSALEAFPSGAINFAGSTARTKASIVCTRIKAIHQVTGPHQEPTCRSPLTC